MTRHLRDTEFVDLAEGTLAASRAAHVETCAACRARADEVAAALREALAVQMPEPSPLFWGHFSARVHEQVAHETPERAGWWMQAGVRSLMPLLAALALVLGVFFGAMLPRIARNAPAVGDLASSHATPDAAPAAVDVDLYAPVDAQNAEVWSVLTAAASDMGLEDAHAAGMATRPGAVDHEVTHLSQAELTELGHLLQTQLKGAGH
jgi:hypothetical protein